MDIKAIIDGFVAAFQQVGSGLRTLGQPASAPAETAPAVDTATAQMAAPAAGILPSMSTMLLTFAVIGLLAYLVRSGFAKRAQAGLQDAVFGNWQLALLGTTGIILSLASGWTTWDGMRNFTGEPILSLMITFGIQGVMLIVAWLIGESFAVGMNQSAPSGDDQLSRPAQTILGSVLGIFFAVAVLALAVSWSGVMSTPGLSLADPGSWVSSDRLLFLAIGAILVAGILLTQQDIVRPYLQGGTVVLRNMVLWVMFLACMATSVFFSFDSLFSAIFPKDERKRAADIRSINQVSGVVADIGALIQTRRIEQAEHLFRSDGWSKYEAQLNAVERLGRRAPDEVRQQMEKELQQRQQRLAELQEQRASAKSGEVGLSTRKVQIAEELTRLESQRPEAQTAANQQKAVVTEIEKRLDEQRALVLAEEKGVEGSGKVGRGKFWRAARGEEQKVLSELQVAKQRYDTHANRLEKIVSRVAAIKRELAEIDGEIAKYKGAAQTVGQMIEVASTDKAGEPTLQSNPIALVSQMSRDRDAFRLDPQEATLAKIQEQCQLLVSTSTKVASLRNEAAAIDCDPKYASQSAAIVFGLNAGAAAYAANCAGGEKMPERGGTDALLSFGRKCLNDSGLPSRDTSAMGTRLASIDLARDDKAHRFVVTWNAFTDGNRLAYLALAIAIAIDSLVFMSGLFGANAVRSPLSDVPTTKARSARALEAIVDTALMPHKFETARLVLGAMKTVTQQNGFMARITLNDEDPHVSDIRRVLNAGSTIGAVRHVDGRDNTYEIRAELFEYLSQVAKREFESNKDHANLAELERVVSVSLLPDVGHNVEIVLHHMHPIEDNPTVFERFGLAREHGFVSEINLGEIEDSYEKKVVRGVLNAGATVNTVQRVESKHYYVHKDLYKTLARIRARTLMVDGAARQLPAQPIHRVALQAAPAPVLANPANERAHVVRRLAGPEPLLPDPHAPPQLQAQSDRPVVYTRSANENFDHVDDEAGRYVAFLSDFEGGLGLLDGELKHLLTSEQSEKLAAQLASWLATIEEKDAILQAEIAALRSAYADAIERSCSQLKQRFVSPKDHRVIDVLMSTIDRLFPILVLRAGGEYEPMLDRVREKIVQHMPSGNSPQWRRDWVSAIDEHRSELASIPRDMRDDWLDVVVELKRFVGHIPNQADTDTDEQQSDFRPPLSS